MCVSIGGPKKVGGLEPHPIGLGLSDPIGTRPSPTCAILPNLDDATNVQSGVSLWRRLCSLMGALLDDDDDDQLTTDELQ